MVVKKQSEPDHPGGAQAGLVRQHEFERTHEMRRAREQHLALDQRLVHETKLVKFEIAQPAVNEFGRGRGSRAGEIALLDEQHG